MRFFLASWKDFTRGIILDLLMQFYWKLAGGISLNKCTRKPQRRRRGGSSEKLEDKCAGGWRFLYDIPLVPTWRRASREIPVAAVYERYVEWSFFRDAASSSRESEWSRRYCT